MLRQEQKSTNSVEMFEATFDRGASRTPDLDDAAALLATSEVMRLFLRRRRALLGLESPTTTSRS
jgi:hypothetical protein